MKNRVVNSWKVLAAGANAFVRTVAARRKPDVMAAGSIEPVSPRVLLIIFNPTIPGEDGRPLRQVLRWNDPDQLTAQTIADLREVSNGYVNYEIVERLEVDDFPVKEDGFRYTGDDFLNRWRTRSGFHHPDLVDYHRLIETHQLIERINAGEIDEVWLHAFPHAGFHESVMAGPGAFWCNAPPLRGTSHANRRFIIMGYNYERGVGEMLEALGHRAESIIRRVYRHKRGQANLWERFIRYDLKLPGQAEVGTVHFAPNSLRDYDWGNPTFVPSRCDQWRNYPKLDGEPRQVNCQDWGNGDIRLHHRWWFDHLPRAEGLSDGVSNNWWEYIIDPNLTP